jgi:hypothetical protein
MPDKVDLAKINQQLTDLSKIEARLNERLASPEFRKQLFADPATILRQEGIVLAPEREQEVVDLFKSAKVPEHAQIEATTLAARPRVGISIGIRVTF